MKWYLPFLFFLLFNGGLLAQISGFVTDDSGKALAYATVQVKGTSTGANTNDLGYFSLDYDEYPVTLIVQFIGYATTTVTLDSRPSDEIKVILLQQAVTLPEAVVDGNGEDPAYAIMRKAIAKRKEHLDWIRDFSCESYVKARYQLDNAPEKIMGQEIGDLEGRLDSTGSGILYLSESISDFYYRYPDDQHEVMKSSVVSGDDQAFSFNRSGVRDALYYNNSIEFGRPMISPVADNAMSYYRYRLEGAFYDQGFLINKIAVLPKNETQAIFSGHIYIVEDIWNIHSLSLITTGEASHITPVDTLWMDQRYVPLPSGEWVMFQQQMRFTFRVLGFNGSGEEIGVHTNYSLSPSYPESMNTNQAVLVLDTSNIYNPEFWDNNRPIPLLEKESTNYVEQDSMMRVRRSPEYRDSMDRKNNKVKPWILLTGYEYENSKNHKSFGFESPLSTVKFNPIQGFNVDFAMEYWKSQRDNISPYTRIKPTINYGFSDQKLRGGIQFTRVFNRHNNLYLFAEADRSLQQYDRSNPISNFLNGIHALLSHEHLARYYQRTGGRLGVGWHTNTGLFTRHQIAYYKRESVFNETDYSLLDTDESYLENIPLIGSILDGGDANIPTHDILQLSGRFEWTFGQEIVKYPRFTFRRRSDLPTVRLDYRAGIPTLGGDLEFVALRLQLTDRFNLGLFGRSFYKLQGGHIFGDDLTTADYFHFSGNELWIASGSVKREFQALPYYFYSTADQFAAAHYDHEFRGYIMERIPLFKKLGWTSFVGASVLKVPELDPYVEFRFGLDRLGYGLFRFFNAAAVLNKGEAADWNWHFRLGVTID